jgi:hypothetical protein
MTKAEGAPNVMDDPCKVYELFERIFEKLHEDLIEAYFRTPDIIASKPYVARALNLSRSALSFTQQLRAKCVGGSARG